MLKPQITRETFPRESSSPHGPPPAQSRSTAVPATAPLQRSTHPGPSSPGCICWGGRGGWVLWLSPLRAETKLVFFCTARLMGGRARASRAEVSSVLSLVSVNKHTHRVQLKNCRTIKKHKASKLWAVGCYYSCNFLLYQVLGMCLSSVVHVRAGCLFILRFLFQFCCTKDIHRSIHGQVEEDSGIRLGFP